MAQYNALIPGAHGKGLYSGQESWMKYKEVKADPGKEYEIDFPVNFQARWIRFTTDKNCRATAWLRYR